MHVTPSDDLDVHDRMREHARIAVEDADDSLADGDRVMAAIRLVEASELYRLAAHALDRDVTPTARG
jgi:hypothetical protein